MNHEYLVRDKLEYYQELDNMSRGTDCIKKIKEPTDPCGFCKIYGFCHKE